AVVLELSFLLKVAVDEGALLQATRHGFSGSFSALLASTAEANDHLVARLDGAKGAALGLAPRADGVTSTGRLALATTVRVVDRVHGDTTDGRALALPPHAAGLAPVDVGLLGVADLANGRAAADVHLADLARRHTQRGVV